MSSQGRCLGVVLCFAAAACGYPVATHCDSAVFGKGVDSTLTIDCGVFDQNAQVAGDTVAAKTAISKDDWLAKMRHVHVRVRSTMTWEEAGERVLGVTSFDHIAVDMFGLSLAHESLHAYDCVADVENAGSALALPVEMTKEHNHVGWTENHYWDADDAYQLSFCPLQPGQWHVNDTVVPNCVQ